MLQNNKIASKTQQRRSGGAVHGEGNVSIINMTGGLIQNNTATWGGGIFITGNAVLNMSGGTIRNNQVISGDISEAWNDAAAGGGVCLKEGATFNLSGTALIQNNSSEETGGGISVGTLEASIYRSNRLFMTGGTVDGNTAGATGGGIFVQAAYVGIRNLESAATITAGNITNNRMTDTGQTNSLFGGGGIYVNGYDYDGFKNGELFLKNVVIADNEVELQGGGYASCPISRTKIYLTDGGAIYGNRADSAEDVYIYCATVGFGAHGGEPEYYVTNTMLGGVPYHWQDDNDDEIPLNKLVGKLTGEDTSLSLHTDEIGNANTASLAKVFITGNSSATCGGGIGSNGNVTIGTADQTIDIPVEKVWDDENDRDEIRPEAVTVELWRKIADSSDAPIYVGHETAKADENGKWLMTFTNLPKQAESGADYEYSVKEREIQGYVGTTTGDAVAGFIITNSYAPPEPTKPEPTEPEPTDPEPTDPEPTEPEPTDPEPTEPEPTEPEPTDPEPTEPEPTEPELTEPEPTDPESSEPEPTEPEPTEPEPTEPEPTEPELTEPESTEPELQELYDSVDITKATESTEPTDSAKPVPGTGSGKENHSWLSPILILLSGLIYVVARRKAGQPDN